jgi:peptidoglycan/xylan/chitin deacetylase (PgdA/CDA1 family)
MKRKLATLNAVNVLAFLAIFGLITILGISIAKTAKNSSIGSNSNNGVVIDNNKVDLQKTPMFLQNNLTKDPATVADTKNHSQSDSAPTSGMNTHSINSPVSQLRASTYLASIVPDVVTPITTNGMVPVFYSIKTNKPVVFLTIDDGIVKDPAARAFLIKHHMVASLFLNDSKIADNYEYFKKLQSDGNVIENHSVNHLNLTSLSYANQKKEICNNADKFATVFGKRPTLFRPPYGAFNDITRRAAADCGMTALIHWHAKANNGGVQFQQGNTLLPGDIVLMHFRTEVIADLTAFDEATKNAKLTTVLLENWIN